ncbi:MAG: LysM peptidoglycan-binding domain-containing protein [Clostridia bacterium]|nr:LysM peptidoglycan-binding domain-containing protein [Clostridia bacterium]
MKRQKRYNWKKGFAKTGLMVIITFVITFGINLVATGANTTTDKAQYIEINVKTGDSLWTLADIYDNNKIDLRKLIYEIKEINNIGDTIYPGQVIKIPVYN